MGKWMNELDFDSGSWAIPSIWDIYTLLFVCVILRHVLLHCCGVSLAFILSSSAHSLAGGSSLRWIQESNTIYTVVVDFVTFDFEGGGWGMLCRRGTRRHYIPQSPPSKPTSQNHVLIVFFWATVVGHLRSLKLVSLPHDLDSGMPLILWEGAFGV